MGTVGENSGTGGHQPKGVGDFFQGGIEGGSIIWFRDVGADPPHGTGPGKFPAQGIQEDNREEAEMTGGWGLGVPTAEDSDGGGGF